MNFNLGKRHILPLAGIALIIAFIIASNILAVMFGTLITNAFYDYGALSQGTEMQLALQQSVALAEEIASEGIVMLKNDNNTLPLTDGEVANKKINVFGWGGTGYVSSDSAKNYEGGFVMSGSGSGNADVTKAKRLLNALEEDGFEYNEELMQIAKDYMPARGGNRLLAEHPHRFFRLYEPPVTSYTAEVMQRAKDHSNIAMIVISRLGGEGVDLPTVQYKATRANAQQADYEIDPTRTYIQLSTEEEDLIQKVAQTGFSKVILVLNTCNIMELGIIDDPSYGIDAVISVGALGTSGALAIPKVLRGKRMSVELDATGNPVKDENDNFKNIEVDFSPSGKTVDIWAYDTKTNPAYVTSGQNYETGHDNAAKVSAKVNGVEVGHNGTTPYTSGGNNYIDYYEDIYVGYRYYETAAAEGFIDYADTVQFPFGFGLSYTEFSWTIGSITPAPGSIITKDTKISIEVLVKNIGQRAGQDVVQAYVNVPYSVGGIEKPYVQLVSFAKTAVLQPVNKVLGANEINEQLLTLEFEPYDFAAYDCYDKNQNGFMGYELESGAYNIFLQTDSHNVKTDCSAVSSVTGVTNGKFTYTVNRDLKFDEDIEVTAEGGEEKILKAAQNYFTGDAANEHYFGIPIDGKSGDNAVGVNAGEGIKMLSRASFDTTFPDTKDPARARLYTIPGGGEKPGYDAPVEGVRPITDAEEVIKISEVIDGKIVLTEDGLTLGKNYSDPLWDTLLDQMSRDEMWELAYRGGYHTIKVDSVGKPFLHDLDGPSGLNAGNQVAGDVKSAWTAFPVETIVGQSWNRMLAYSMGLAVGQEAKASGVGGWYAPACNIHRSAFGGRNFEYFSEDPLLSGLLSADVSQGALTNGLYTYVKHFVANESESNRGGLRTWLSEQALREIYLKPFEIAVKKGSASGIMTSFNFLGAVWTGGAKPLCTDILRGEWGFRGAVCTDYFAGSGDWMNAAQGLRAGNDLWIGQDDQPTFQDRQQNLDSELILTRRAAHNILFAFANAMWYDSTHTADDARFTLITDVSAATEPFAWWWIWGMLPLNLVALGGIGAIFYFTFIHKKKGIVAPEQPTTTE